jgi:hypothetical protein
MSTILLVKSYCTEIAIKCTEDTKTPVASAVFAGAVRWRTLEI